MSALTERLRAGTFPIGEPDPLCAEAADTIDALAEALRAQEKAEQYRHDIFALASDGTRLTQQHTHRAEELFEKARQFRRAALAKAGL